MHCINVYCSWSTGSNNAQTERLCVCVCTCTGLTGRPTAAGGKRLRPYGQTDELFRDCSYSKESKRTNTINRRVTDLDINGLYNTISIRQDC